MKARELTLQPAGLLTDPSEFGAVPSGAMLRLDDCIMRQAGIIEPRPGFVSISLETDFAGRPESIVPYDGALMVWRMATDTGTRYLGVLEADDDYNDLTGENAPPDPAYWAGRGCTMRRNFYFQTDSGPKKITSKGDLSPDRAGVMPPVYLYAGTVGGGQDVVFTTNGERAAYRACIRREDANGVVVRSAPSDRVVVENNNATADGTITAYLDSTQIDTACVLEVYRSEITTGTPSDEMQLVVEQRLAASAASVTVTDTTPETARGAALYTSPSQGGILAANQLPPRSRDVVAFRDSLFFIEADEPQRITARIKSSMGGVNTLVGDVSSGTDTILNCTGISDLRIGMLVWETGAITSISATRRFPPGTYVTAISGGTVTVSANAVSTAVGVSFEYHWDGLGGTERYGFTQDATNQLTDLVTSTSIRVGMRVWDGAHPFATGTNIDADTYVSSITGSGPYTITLSKNAIGTGFARYYFSDILTVNGVEWAYTTDSTTAQASIANRVLPHRSTYYGTQDLAADRAAMVVCEYMSRWVSANAGTYTIHPWVRHAQPYYADERIDDGPAGVLVWEERQRDNVGIVLTVNSGARSFFEPAIPADGLVSVQRRHAVVWSETGEPEHVRLLSYAGAGEEWEPAWRGVATRDALFLFKRDGIWRLTGTGGQWRIDPVSTDHRLLGPECVGVLGDAVYAWTNHGVVRITDGGITQISHPRIRKDLRADEETLLDDGWVGVQPVTASGILSPPAEGSWVLTDRAAAFLVCNPKESEVVVGAPGTDGADALWVWSEKFGAWVGKWVSGAALSRCACFDPSVGRLVLGHIDAHVVRERTTSGAAGRADWDLVITDDLVTSTTIRETYNPNTDNAANDLAANENVTTGAIIRVVASNGTESLHRVTAAPSITIVNGTTHRRTWTVTPALAAGVVSTPGDYSFRACIPPAWLCEFTARDHRDPLTAKLWTDGAILWTPRGSDYDGTFALSFANELESYSADQTEDHDYHANRFFVPSTSARGLYQRIRVEPGTTLGVVWGIHGLALSFRPYSTRVHL
jgi:hypothetical protein